MGGGGGGEGGGAGWRGVGRRGGSGVPGTGGSGGEGMAGRGHVRRDDPTVINSFRGSKTGLPEVVSRLMLRGSPGRSQCTRCRLDVTRASD